MAGRGGEVCRRRAASQTHYFVLLSSTPLFWQGARALRAFSTLLLCAKTQGSFFGLFPGTTLDTLAPDVHNA